jgi:hypothetical protein
MKPMSKIEKRITEAGRARRAQKDIVELLDSTAHLQTNTFWDQAAASYSQIKEATTAGFTSLIESAHAYNEEPLPADPVARAEELKQRDRVATILTTLTQDTAKYFEQLDSIHEKHKDRSGTTRGADDFALLTGVHGAYTNATAQYHAVANSLAHEIQLLTGDVQRIMDANAALTPPPQAEVPAEQQPQAPAPQADQSATDPIKEE